MFLCKPSPKNEVVSCRPLDNPVIAVSVSGKFSYISLKKKSGKIERFFYMHFAVGIVL